jgi:hypothetical protein
MYIATQRGTLLLPPRVVRTTDSRLTSKLLAVSPGSEFVTTPIGHDITFAVKLPAFLIDTEFNIRFVLVFQMALNT